MKSRHHRKEVANETLLILSEGRYTASNGESVNIKEAIGRMAVNTQLYTENQLQRLAANALQSKSPYVDTAIAVVNETALEGAARLVKSEEWQHVGVLNFASAKNPGGGFLGGSLAQEESLAVASALYQSLIQCREGYYDYHRGKNLLYSDRMIYTPDCPVFRDDDGRLLDEPYHVDFVTSPAPNPGAMRDRVSTTLRERSEKILALFAEKGCDALVLGAWGCGVFRNAPATVADVFAEHLKPDGRWHGRFRFVRFSVLDRSRSGENITAFESAFR